MIFIGSVVISQISGSATVIFGNTISLSPSSTSSSTADSDTENANSLSLNDFANRTLAPNSSRVKKENRNRSFHWNFPNS